MYWELSGELTRIRTRSLVASLPYYSGNTQQCNKAFLNAKNVWIHASLDDKYFFLSITDDGIGFDKEAVALGRPLVRDLEIFLTALHFLRGQVIIDTLPQQGVRYQIKTPLNYAK